MSNHNMIKLQAGIIASSVSGTWEAARMEWGLDFITWNQEDECLCGHNPIVENCILKNELNGSQVLVGNVCVHKFMGMDCHLIFSCLKRIVRDPTCQLNEETILYSFRRQLIDSWEYGFSLSTMRKWDLSFRQRKQRRRINQKILNHVGVSLC